MVTSRKVKCRGRPYKHPRPPFAVRPRRHILSVLLRRGSTSILIKSQRGKNRALFDLYKIWLQLLLRQTSTSAHPIAHMLEVEQEARAAQEATVVVHPVDDRAISPSPDRRGLQVDRSFQQSDHTFAASHGVLVLSLAYDGVISKNRTGVF